MGLKSAPKNDVLSQNNVAVLESSKFIVADADFSLMLSAILWPAKLMERCGQVSDELVATKDQFLAQMEGEMIQFERELTEVKEKIDAFGKHSDLGKVVAVAAEATTIVDTLSALDAKSKQ